MNNYINCDEFNTLFDEDFEAKRMRASNKVTA